jgi:hypothetical protein
VPVPADSKPKPQPKRKYVPVRIFGYAVTPEWLGEFNKRHRLAAPGPHGYYGRSAACRYIRIKTGSEVTQVRHPDDHRIGRLCFGIADNRTTSGLANATKERIETLQKVMEMTEPPRWYEWHDDDDSDLPEDQWFVES